MSISPGSMVVKLALSREESFGSHRFISGNNPFAFSGMQMSFSPELVAYFQAVPSETVSHLSTTIILQFA